VAPRRNLKSWVLIVSFGHQCKIYLKHAFVHLRTRGSLVDQNSRAPLAPTTPIFSRKSCMMMKMKKKKNKKNHMSARECPAYPLAPTAPMKMMKIMMKRPQRSRIRSAGYLDSPHLLVEATAMGRQRYLSPWLAVLRYARAIYEHTPLSCCSSLQHIVQSCWALILRLPSPSPTHPH